MAEIKDNSLLLFDEPETHLHPNAISNLITALYEILSKFNSFCIVATHSPMIIQEVSSKCVFILRRIDDCLEINKPNYETFAESITTITDDIFGNRQVGRYYKKALDLLSEETESYEDILKILFDEYSLTMTFEQYALVGSTVKSYLSFLKDTEKLNIQFTDNKLLWYKV